MPILNSAYFTAWYDDMTSAFGKVCRIKNRHTFKSMPILNSAYFTECRFVIRHITQTETQTETELLRRHTEGGGGLQWWPLCVISRGGYVVSSDGHQVSLAGQGGHQVYR